MKCMSDVPGSRCGFSYPADVEGGRDEKQNCCIRSPLPDTDRCKWHAEPENTTHKTEELGEISSVAGSLDGVILNQDSTPEYGLQLGRHFKNILARSSDLSGISIQRVDFSEADFRDADLSGADLRGSNLTGIDFGRATLSAVEFSEVDLSTADLQKADLSNATFDSADFTAASLQGADITGSNLKNADLAQANLSDSEMIRADLRSATLTDTVFHEARLEKIDLRNTHIKNQQLIDAHTIDTFVETQLVEGLEINDSAPAGVRTINPSDEVPSGRCGHTTFTDQHIWTGKMPHRTSCYLPSLESGEKCIWHIEPENCDRPKTVENLSAHLFPRDEDAVETEKTPSRKSLYEAGRTFQFDTQGTGQLLDEAELADVEIAGGINLDYVSLRRSNLTDADLSETSFDDADLTGSNLEGVNLKNSSLQNTELLGVYMSEATITNANLGGANLSRSVIMEADLSDAYLDNADLSQAKLRNTTLQDARLGSADLSNGKMREANLSGISSSIPDLSGATFRGGNLSEADLQSANISKVTLDNADISDANLSNASLRGSSFDGADLSNTNLEDADLSKAVLKNTNLSKASLLGAILSEADLERATMVDVNLFDADLTKVTPYGARIEAVKINDGTEFFRDTSEYSCWWQQEAGFLATPPRCGYDPQVEQPDHIDSSDRDELLTKAADTYRQFEDLARENTQPSVQSSMYLLRQDMQRKRFRERGQYIQWVSNRMFRAVFKHGESFSRLLLTAGIIILVFSGAYWQGDLILDNPGITQQEPTFLNNPIDALYFSTLTFTTLGLGDYQPAAVSQLGRGLVLLEAVIGAILIATFVFVLGRRAAR